MDQSMGQILDSLDPVEVLDLMITRTRRRLDDLIRLKEIVETGGGRLATDTPAELERRILKQMPKLDEPNGKPKSEFSKNPVMSPVKFALLEFLEDGQERTAKEIMEAIQCCRQTLTQYQKEGVIQIVRFNGPTGKFQMTDAGKQELAKMKARVS